MSLFVGIRCIFCWSLQSITKQQRSVFTGILMHHGLLSNHPVNVVSWSQLSLSLYTLAVFLIQRSSVYIAVSLLSGLWACIQLKKLALQIN